MFRSNLLKRNVAPYDLSSKTLHLKFIKALHNLKKKIWQNNIRIILTLSDLVNIGYRSLMENVFSKVDEKTMKK